MHSTFAPPRPRGTYAQLLASRRALLARHALGVSASPRSRSNVRESGSGPRCHGSDGVFPSGRDRREAGGGAEAAADAAAAQSCRAPERWHTARRRRRRPPRWLSLLSRRRFASRRRQLLRRESSEATYAPQLCGSSKERTRWHQASRVGAENGRKTISKVVLARTGTKQVTPREPKKKERTIKLSLSL